MKGYPLRLVPLACASLVMLSAAGCSREPDYAEVDGVITMDGRPLPLVEVIFFPDPEKGTVGPRATAYTDAEGRFTLGTRQSNKNGALVGFHRICIRDLTALAAAPAPPPVDGEPAIVPPKRPKRPKVALLYWDPSTTPLKDIEVKTGKQSLNLSLNSEPGSGKWE